MLLLARAGAAAGQEPPAEEEVEALVVAAAARCRVRFNATGFPEAVVFRNHPEKALVFSDRPARLAATARPCEAAAGAAAGEGPPNVTGWRKGKKKGGGWRRAHAVVTATGVAWDAATRELRYAVVQVPGQAGATKGFRRVPPGSEGGGDPDRPRPGTRTREGGGPGTRIGGDPFLPGAEASNNKNTDICTRGPVGDQGDGSGDSGGGWWDLVGRRG